MKLIFLLETIVQNKILIDFLVILVSAGAIQGFLLGLFLIFNNKGYKSGNRLLGVLLLLFSYVAIINVLLYTEYLLRLPHLAFTQSAIAFIIAPAYYFYLKALVEQKLAFKWYHVYHFLPFAVFLLLTSSFYFKTSTYKIELLRIIYNSKGSLESIPFNKYIFYSILILQMGFYTFGILKTINSKRNGGIALGTWVFTIYWLFILLLLTTRIIFFYDVRSSIALPIYITFGIYGLAYWSLVRQGFFHNLRLDTVKYKKSKPSRDAIQNISHKLKDILENEKLYLDPDITASKVAKKIPVSTHTLSYIINEELEDSFYDLINRMRIHDAKLKLKNKTLAHLSIEGIGKESGFKSKSSFYRAFKKFTGKTPSEFQRV